METDSNRITTVDHLTIIQMKHQTVTDDPPQIHDLSNPMRSKNGFLADLLVPQFSNPP